MIFKELDTDGDETINMQELQAAMEPHFPHPTLAAEFCQKLVIGMDLDNDGTVSMPELTNWYIRHFKEVEIMV